MKFEVTKPKWDYRGKKKKTKTQADDQKKTDSQQQPK